MLDKTCSGVSYSAVDCEFNGNTSAIYTNTQNKFMEMRPN